MDEITTIGIDLAKTFFRSMGVDASGAVGGALWQACPSEPTGGPAKRDNRSVQRILTGKRAKPCERIGVRAAAASAAKPCGEWVSQSTPLRETSRPGG